MYGNRGIYKDGWWAASMLPRIPWVVTPEIMKNFAPGVFDPGTLEWELFSAYSGLDIGRDNGEVVDRDYEAKAPFAFTGTIEKVTFDIRHPADPAAHAALHQAQHAGQQARHTES